MGTEPRNNAFLANFSSDIDGYKAALQVRTEAEYPSDWARTTNNLGNAYLNLPTGDRAANLQQAIDCYEAALRVRTETDYPTEWAGTTENLALATDLLRQHMAEE